jgi:hypothetical protein
MPKIVIKGSEVRTDRTDLWFMELKHSVTLNIEVGSKGLSALEYEVMFYLLKYQTGDNFWFVFRDHSKYSEDKGLTSLGSIYHGIEGLIKKGVLYRWTGKKKFGDPANVKYKHCFNPYLVINYKADSEKERKFKRQWSELMEGESNAEIDSL